MHLKRRHILLNGRRQLVLKLNRQARNKSILIAGGMKSEQCLFISRFPVISISLHLKITGNGWGLRRNVTKSPRKKSTNEEKSSRTGQVE